MLFVHAIFLFSGSTSTSTWGFQVQSVDGSSYSLILIHFQAQTNDPQQSRMQVIRKMDALLGISDDITMALLGHVTETEIEMKLDLQILYLRRVHHFCFYAGKWCKDCTNGCFRNRFVLDSMTCAQTCALDCE